MENPRFLERVFTEGERDAIAHKGASTAAGLWAAKEAVSKALGTGFVGSVSYTHLATEKRRKTTVFPPFSSGNPLYTPWEI